MAQVTIVVKDQRPLYSEEGKETEYNYKLDRSSAPANSLAMSLVACILLMYSLKSILFQKLLGFFSTTVFWASLLPDDNKRRK
jgi:hypothetical protein